MFSSCNMLRWQSVHCIFEVSHTFPQKLQTELKGLAMNKPENKVKTYRNMCEVRLHLDKDVKWVESELYILWQDYVESNFDIKTKSTLLIMY